MQTATNERSLTPPRPALPLSRSTILILSGVLIGMGVSYGVTPDTQLYGFVAGIIGLFAFLGLDSHTRHQEQRAVQRAIDQATCVIENRLCRHIPVAAGKSSAECSEHEPAHEPKKNFLPELRLS